MMTEGYAGEVTSREAWDILAEDGSARLVDVRTDAEWAFVGLPDLASLGKDLVRVPWQIFPAMAPNAAFVDQVAAAGVARDQTVLLICRSGARSRKAAIALTQRGFARCLNVSDGFEGPLDEGGHRGSVEGWKAARLPWRQA